MAFIEIDTIDRQNSWDLQYPHSNNYYELSYVFDGKREYVIDGEKFVATKNSFILIPPDALTKTETNRCKQLFISFDRDYVSVLTDDIINVCFNNTVTQIDNANVPTFLQLIKQITDENDFGIKQDNLMLKIKILELLLQLNRYFNSHSTVENQAVEQDTFINNIAHYIDENFADCTLENLAKKFYVSDAHLSREFKKHIGVNISEYISNKKIALATYLLKNSPDTINEISDKCGFSSPNYFGLKFKSIVGISPMQFRKANKPVQRK